NLIVQLRPNVDAILPEKEQIPRERYRPQDRIRAYVLDVDMTSKGPQIVLSRTHPGFLKKAFEQEVPEIYEGIVEIKAVARRPRSRRSSWTRTTRAWRSSSPTTSSRWRSARRARTCGLPRA